VVCTEGDCGACSVLVAWPFRPNPSKFKSPFRVINACIAPIYSLDGSSVVTVEGLKYQDGKLSSVQKSFVDNFASQCGYCTPGFVCASTYLCEQYANKPVTTQKIKNVLTGNLCRCTGYETIIEAVEKAIPQYEHNLAKRYLTPMFLKHLKSLSRDSIHIATESGKILFLPKSEKEVTQILKKNKDLRISSSNTDLGVIHNKEKIDLYKVLSLANVESLYKIKITPKLVTVGSRVDLETLRRMLESRLGPISEFLNIFASPPIRCAATLVGNFANASPIADNSPWILAFEGYLNIQGPKGVRRVSVNDFFVAYKKTALKAGEWIQSLTFHIPQANTLKSLRLYKISTRRDLDISCVNMVLSVAMKNQSIKDFRWAMGGVAATTHRDLAFDKSMLNKKLNSNELFSELARYIDTKLKPISDLRGSHKYRTEQLKSLVKKYIYETQGELV
jgi:xanthine dehydrogenase small subunit